MHLVLFICCAGKLRLVWSRKRNRPLGRAAFRASGGFLVLAPDHGPALQLRDRLALLDPHHVARLELVALVVGVVVLRAADGLLVDRVGEAPVDAHDHGLGLLVADDNALEGPFRHVEPLTSSWRAAARRWS